MLILYEFPISPFAQKVKMALREKGLDFEARNGFDAEYAADFTQGNPRRELPFLIDGDVRVTDSTIIVDYIDERWPETPLLPAEPALRARARMLEELADTRLEALNYCIAEVTSVPVGEDEAAAAVIEATRAEWSRQQGILATELGEAGFFGGDGPDRSDFSLLPHLNAARVLKMGADSGPLADWLQRMNAHPSVADTVAEIKAAVPAFKEMYERVNAGEGKRQFRDHRLDWLITAGGLPILAKRIAAGNVRFAMDTA